MPACADSECRRVRRERKGGAPYWLLNGKEVRKVGDAVLVEGGGDEAAVEAVEEPLRAEGG